jgi:hypothetical protein
MPVLPRPRTVETSPGSLSWLCESLPTPDLQFMAPERPRTMVESLAPLFTKYHSSLVTGLCLCPGRARDNDHPRLFSFPAAWAQALCPLSPGPHLPHDAALSLLHRHS